MSEEIGQHNVAATADHHPASTIVTVAGRNCWLRWIGKEDEPATKHSDDEGQGQQCIHGALQEGELAHYKSSLLRLTFAPSLPRANLESR